MAKAIADFLAAQNNAAQIIAVRALLRRLVQQMINKSRNTNEHIGLEFAQVANVAFRAHDFAAAGAEHQRAGGGSGIVRQPKREVRRERKSVQQTVLAATAANLDQPSARCGKMREVPLRVEKRCRVGASTRGKSHENRTELGFKSSFDALFSVHQCAQHGSWTLGQDLWIRHQNKILERERVCGAIEQVSLCSERDSLQVL